MPGKSPELPPIQDACVSCGKLLPRGQGLCDRCFQRINDMIEADAF